MNPTTVQMIFGALCLVIVIVMVLRRRSKAH